MGKWPMVRIGDVCEFIRNGANIIQDNSKKGFPITRIETISNGVFDRNRMGYAGIYDLGKYGDYVLKTGDILMSHINSVSHLGKTAYYENIGDETIIHGMNLLCLRLKKEQVDYKYTFYYLNSPFFKRQIPKITKKSVNQASFTVTALKQLKFILPPLNMQKRIADILDKTQEIIDGYKKQLTELDNLIKAVFYEMFGDPLANDKGWTTVLLKEVLANIRYGTSTPPNFSETGYKFIRATNIKKGRIVEEDMKFISKEESLKLKKCKIYENEMIIVRSGVNSGDTCVISNEYSGHYAGYDLILTFDQNKVDPVFVNELFNTNYMEIVIKPLTRRAAQPHLNSEQVQSLRIILPPLDLQTKFATIVTKIEEQKVLVKRAITDSEQLFNSLMSEYFD